MHWSCWKRTDPCHSGWGFSPGGCAGGLKPGWEERSGDSAGKPESQLKINSTLLLLVSLFNVYRAASLLQGRFMAGIE